MVNGYVLSVMYYVLRFCCSAVRAGLSWSEMSKMSKMSKACFAGVESFAPLAGPATAGKKSGKWGIGKYRADVQNVDMVYAQRHYKVSECWLSKMGLV